MQIVLWPERYRFLNKVADDEGSSFSLILQKESVPVSLALKLFLI